MSLDVNKIRADFPILQRKVYGKPLVYLDNAATTQKPQAVLDTLNKYYTSYNSNIHRGVHALSQEATENFNYARAKVMHFINAVHSKEIIFVRGATEGINLVAQTFGRQNINEGDEIIISEMEHHSNIVPWKMLADERGAKLKVIPVTDEGELNLAKYKKLFSERTKIVAVSHVSNVLGTVNPVEEIVEIAHEHGVPVLLDGAQAAPHIKVDVQKIDCDFYVFSGHKVYGPTGIGVLYGKMDLLDKMPPYQGGGDMICTVTFKKIKYRPLPSKFEAGTPNIAGSIALKAALDYVDKVGIENIQKHEEALLKYATTEILKIPGVKILGTAKNKVGVLAFTVKGVHPHDIGTILDQEGIAIRTGYHCAQPLGDRFNVPATARASFAMYNTLDEVKHFIVATKKAVELLS